VITKLQRVRHGFLHNLLTRGIDENGELRDATRQPEKFMNSLLGLIPRGWGVASLGQFLTSAEYGISTSLSTEGVLPVLRMNNLANGEASISDLKYATFEVPARLILRDGDVLFNRTNSFEHVGRTGIWRGQIQRATFASYLVRLNPVPTRLTSEFLNLVLNSREVQRRMRRFATPAVQQVNISPSSLQRMHIAVPERIEEQEQIAARALSMRDSVDSHTRELHKLRSLRAGLMSDLLQGRVRVPEDLKIEATA
jgi:type I restriction enzyme S subunit